MGPQFLVARQCVTLLNPPVSKPALGRGLGDLLNPGRQQNPPTAPLPDGNEPVSSGGVATLLQGKKETPAHNSGPAGIMVESKTPKAAKVIRWSLACADLGLVAAGGLIARQNPFSQSPVWFCFGLGLVGFGAWLGCLAWGYSGTIPLDPNPGISVSNEKTAANSKPGS